HTKDWLLKAPATNYQHYWETKKTFTASRELRKKSRLVEWHSGSWDHTEVGWTSDRTSFYHRVDHVLVQWHQRRAEGATDKGVPVRLWLRRGNTTTYSAFKKVPLPDPKHALYLVLTYTPKKVSYLWKNLKTGVVLAEDAIEDPEKIPKPQTTSVLVNGSLSLPGSTGSYFSHLPGGFLQWGNKPTNGGMVWVTDYWLVRNRMIVEPEVKVGLEKTNSVTESEAFKDFIARVEEAKGSEKNLLSLLSATLEESEKEDLRWLACRVLGEANPEGSSAVLARAFEQDPGSEVVWSAASALAAVDPAKAEAVFIGTLQASKDSGRLCPAIRWLGRMKAVNAVEILKAAVIEKEREFEVRREAVAALGEIQDPFATTALMACLDAVREKDVLFLVLVTLGGVSSSRIVERVIPLVEQEEDRLLADRAWKTYYEILHRFPLPAFPPQRTRARLYWRVVKEYALWGEIRVTPKSKAQLEKLIADLDDEAYTVREKAHKELESMGVLAASRLKKALTHKSLEVSSRAQRILNSIRPDDTKVLEAAEKAAGELRTSAPFLRFLSDSPDESCAARAKALLAGSDAGKEEGK
ncbi:MAG: HEAT repeat domain-containing protein, partial [Planctomycetota bacterium]